MHNCIACFAAICVLSVLLILKQYKLKDLQQKGITGNCKDARMVASDLVSGGDWRCYVAQCSGAGGKPGSY